MSDVATATKKMTESRRRQKKSNAVFILLIAGFRAAPHGHPMRFEQAATTNPKSVAIRSPCAGYGVSITTDAATTTETPPEFKQRGVRMPAAEPRLPQGFNRHCMGNGYCLFTSLPLQSIVCPGASVLFSPFPIPTHTPILRRR